MNNKIYLELIKEKYFLKIEKNKLIKAIDENYENISLSKNKQKLKRFFNFKHNSVFKEDFWHGNPSKVNKNDIHPILKISYEDMWKKDNRKIDIAKLYGYDTLIVWEDDYKKIKKK